MHLAELQDHAGNRFIKRARPPQEELDRLQAMMPTRFGSFDDLPTTEELASLSDEDLFEEA